MPLPIPIGSGLTYRDAQPRCRRRPFSVRAADQSAYEQALIFRKQFIEASAALLGSARAAKEFAFCLNWRDVTDRFHWSMVVEPVHPFQRSGFDGI
jgi:hypothetical protein